MKISSNFYIYLIAFLSVFAVQSNAQNFVQLTDASGDPSINDYLSQLQGAADSLVSVFPSPYDTQFKVYDFGFYLHQEDYDGWGYPEEFEKMVETISSPYYLVFGRQTDENGMNSKVWVDLKLPGDGIFECLTENVIEVFKLNVDSDANRTELVFHDELRSILEFSLEIEKLQSCCTNGVYDQNCGPCIINLSEMRDYFLSKGFIRLHEGQIVVSEYSGYQNIQSDLKIEVHRDGVYYSYTDDLEQMLGQVNGQARISHFDENNCGEFSAFQQLTDIGFEYSEEIVVFSFNGIPEVFINIGGVDEESRESIRSNRACPPCAIAAAIIIEEVSRRLVMSAGAAVIHIMVEVAIEWYIGEYTADGEGLYNAFVAKNFTSARELWKIGGAALSGAVADRLYLSAGINAFSNLFDYFRYVPFTWNSFALTLSLTVAGSFLEIAGADILGSVSSAIIRRFNGYYMAIEGICINEILPLFAQNFKILPKLGRLVTAWQKLFSFPYLRKRLVWLERVSDWITKNIELYEEAGQILIANGPKELGKIVDNVLHVKFSGFGGDIVCDASKTTTAIGKWDPIGDGSGAGGTMELIDSGLSKSGKNPGGLNVLDDPNPENYQGQALWDNINEPWLQAASSRGDIIRAISDPSVPSNIYRPDGTLSFFGREHEILTKPVSQGGLGYTYDPSSFTYVK